MLVLSCENSFVDARITGFGGTPIRNEAFPAWTSGSPPSPSKCRMAAQEEADAPSFSTTELVPADDVRVAKSGLSADLRWITDPWDRGVLFSVKVDHVLHDVRSKFQRIQVP